MIEARLIEVDIRQADLYGGRLELADLSWVIGSEACFEDVKLECAVLKNADLCKADLISATLTNADLRMANPRGTKFGGAMLERSDLSAAN